MGIKPEKQKKTEEIHDYKEEILLLRKDGKVDLKSITAGSRIRPAVDRVKC